MRFSVTTLGCKANQYDTGTVVSLMLRSGHMQAKPGSGCDVCIVNTCAVTAESVRKSRQAVRRVKKQEPNALIAVCGCYPQLEHNAAAALGADIVAGVGDSAELVSRIEKSVIARSNVCCAEGGTKQSNDRTRALLKIQDGCDNCCAYCIIPKARGPSRSLPPDKIALEAKLLERQSYKEIVVTGIEISSYRFKRNHLAQALKAISANAPNARIRLGSLNPCILTDGFINELAKVPNLCDHFHISLQSGCDDTLARMGRKYNIKQVYDSISKLRGTFDNCGITADLIVGFPGETEEEFAQTLAFLDKAAFSAMHIFPYSKRPGTTAADLPGQVADSVKQQRAKTASCAAAKHNREFKEAQVGKTLEVLFETKKGKYSIGHSGNYLSVATADEVTRNTIASVRVTGIEDGMLVGEIVNKTI